MVFAAMILATSFCFAQTSEQSVPESSKQLARLELNEAAASYQQGNFEDAQTHSQNALTLDPSSKTARMFLARCIHAQYRPIVDTDENRAKAREAIEAYKQILAQNPKDDEAYKAIAYLLVVLKEEKSLHDWVLARALDTSFEATKRAEAYVVLASKDWDCSFKITELPISKVATLEGKKLKVRYRMPPYLEDFEKARECTNRGVGMADMAISLDPENESAWAYKTNLLLQQAKLSEMMKDESEKERLLSEYEVALAETNRISKAKTEAEEKKIDALIQKKLRPF